MFPSTYGFQWTPGYLIFLGLFYSVIVAVACTVLTAAVRTVRAFRSRREGVIRWQSDFHDLGEEDRRCRHMFTGEFQKRTCRLAFDCRECVTHGKLIARNGAVQLTSINEPGIPVPLDRFYHRGHTWVRPEPDGTVTIGLDELGRRLVGRPDALRLPSAGTHLAANGPGWRIERGGNEIRILSPLDGKVVATGGTGADWFLKLLPDKLATEWTHLLRGPEVVAWMRSELDKLQVSATLADGGTPVEDIGANLPEADWDAICGRVFLEP